MNETLILTYTAIISLAYLIGSIPFGIVLGPLFKVGDIRSIGSGNIGATNALRTGNKKFAIAVLLGDAVKGAIAICLARYFFGDMAAHAGLIAGLVALIGHVFPIWLRFKGGKGVATGAGILLALHWPAGLMCLAIWLITARLSRYSSLSAIMAALHAPFYAVVTQGREYALPFCFISVVLLWTHHDNIRRLAKGEESTIKVKSS
jgi:glycerol-3-phosphate acyltransferase PlsY